MNVESSVLEMFDIWKGSERSCGKRVARCLRIQVVIVAEE